MYKRIGIAFSLLIFVFGILISNLGIIMLKTGISPSSQGTSTKSVVLSTSRGMIYDTNMKKIVNNETTNTTVCLPVQQALNALKNSLDNNHVL